MGGGEIVYGVHVHALPVEMHGQDEAGLFAQGPFQAGGVHEIGVGVHIDKAWRTAGGDDGGNRRHRRVGNGDDLVVVLDAESPEAEGQGVGAAVDADPMGDVAIVRKGGLESTDAFAQD